MLSGVGAMVAAYLWRRRDWPLIIPVQKVAACAGLLTAFLYAWLAGFQIPAQRTLYMVGVVAFALWTSRIARPFDIWWIALFLVLLIDPMAPYTPGFWLSFGAVAVILYGMGASSSLIGIPNGNEWERDRLSRFVQALKESCRLQWIVTIALLPCTLFWFYQVSVVSPIANALAIPVISFMVTPLAIGGALLPELFAPFLLKLSHDVMELTAHYLNWLASFDGAVVWSHQPSYWAIALSVLGIYLHVQPGLIRNHLASRILGLLLIVPIFASHPSVIHHGEYRVNVFDIGQGTAVLVETKNHRLLYDAGPLQGRKDNAGERVLLPYFRGEGINKLDRLVISHQDSDHIGGATSLMQAIQIQSFLGTIPMTHSLFHEIMQRDIPALPCRYGQEWIWDGIYFKVWHPSEELTFEQQTHRRKPNENSCVLEVRNSVASFWLTGDIEKLGEHEHAQRIRAINYQGPDQVILMAPHHGSKTSSSKDWLETLKPTIAFAQYGYLNRYGHPHKNIRDRYHELEIPFLGTSTTGGQIWNVSNQELHVELLRQTRKRLWHDH
jgi:competence protein ComEC